MQTPIIFIDMHIIKNKIIFFVLLQIILPYCIFGNDDAPKSYFVKPIEVFCDYPFNDTTKWAVTCRVWGLLKYYHPNVAAGKLDWDEVLIDRIVKINEAKTAEQVNSELMQMIRIAGDYEFQNDPIWNDSLNMNVNLCWLDHSFINDSIRQTLMAIAALTTNLSSYYIKPTESSGPALNEKEYDESMIDRYEYRLLALFRYWNVIYYFFPYKYLMDQSWDKTLSEFIPQFMNAGDLQSYHDVVIKLAAQLNDGHALTNVTPVFYRSKRKYMILIDSLTVVCNTSKGSMLERGDIIISVDGKNINTIRDSIASFIPSSHRRFKDHCVNGFLYLSYMNDCMLTVMRNQQVITFREQWKNIFNETLSTKPFSSITSNISYVNLENLNSSDILGVLDSMRNNKAIIFDLRNSFNNSSWELIYHLSQTQEYCYGLATCVNWFQPGVFYEEKCIMKYPDKLWKTHEKHTGKIVVLIDEKVMSAGETLAMSFRILGFTLIGTSTAGANGDATTFSLPGNIKVWYSGLGFYYPDGTQTQRIGIIPDIEVYPTMDDIIAGRDEVLEAAINYLNSN